MVLHQTAQTIEIKSSEDVMGAGFVTFIMAGIGVYLIYIMVPLQDSKSFGEIIGLVFLCLWTTTAVIMGLLMVSSGCAVLRIDDEGVSYRSLLRKQALTWSEIADYGLSYCGQSRGEGNTYDLYFSSRQQLKKNECSKKLKGKMIKFTVTQSEYSQIVEKVISFCHHRTKVEPFVGADKFHFI